jgi:hypothetical protein
VTETFNASKHLIKLKGKDYLEVKFRLLWLRTEHPDAVITTTLLEHDKDAGLAVVHANVSIPGKGVAGGLGSETRKDFNDYLEKAETKALGRALAALGFGTQFCEDWDFSGETDNVVDAPVTPPKVDIPRETASKSQWELIDSLHGADTKKNQPIILKFFEDNNINPKEARQVLTKRQATSLIDVLKKAA